ncbi:MAG: NUDIX hydrolase [Acidobacteria bacterium]|nr:NUDIX hydrolase [Acidobacteriota bacterium]
MKETPDEWKRIESREIADCRVFKVREDRSVCGEKSGTFFVIENPDWVNVVALTPDQQVVLIEQFRHGVEQVTLEIPGGMIDGVEDPETAARRELLEETGFSSDNWIYLGTSCPNPALQSNVIHHFLAVDAVKTEDVKFDEHESVVTSLAHIMEIPNLIRNGRIRHSLVVAAFQYFSFQWFKSL